MSNLTKGLILIVLIVAVGAGLVVWKKKYGGSSSSDGFNSISRDEIEMLLGDIAEQNPMAIKRLASQPELKKKQLDGLKQLLAFASQAQKDGMADDPANKQELENIKAEVKALNYDHEINKDKGPMPEFGFITEDQLKQYWGEDIQPQEGKEPLPPISASDKAAHEAEFQKFLDGKLALMKADNPSLADHEITDQEKEQAKDYFAKIHIYADEYDKKVDSMDPKFKQKTQLQIKLEQAQFLAKQYSSKIADTAKVTDDEVNQYIAAHPELGGAEQKAKAQEILDKAKAPGADFAALANQYSEDPGNKDEKGNGKGGLYTDVKKGQMVPEFEAAALALEPGQIAPDLVQSNYGYHIIKLEKKSEGKDAQGNPTQSYDVRHILITTTYKDPDNPQAPPMPIKDYVKQKLGTDKRQKIVDDIVAQNNITVPDDYTIPEVTDQQIQDQMKQQGGPAGLGMPPGAGAPPQPGPATKDDKKETPKKAK